ncbi:pyridine nucleotide-disulfide oxidoreductase [Halobacillus andaensis]|uniref:Pyridine nucleotide-disulfide oxidoreductase n=1 Tax=Halobacillus andaensis TaxID=1176239 RepID=A0A917EVU6_HALAA|nr:NAD(P)/FAD-dependent oxidoreductase [Halobacillus andaensis]MBP2006104.1 thioredoxin reductase [Halobacillus andaensis]GGF23620.1 pyridine nucleotide-disulfide oxidoreductase [Halobacillus andaensis]
MNYDCIIIGGGVAGLQASIQLGRYMRKVAVIDAEEGRSTLCQKYNNILGFPHGVSGDTLRQAGREHAERLGVHFYKDEVCHLHKESGWFEAEGQISLRGKTVLLATGVKDHIPNIPGIEPCLGLSVFVCPDCDGYEIKGKKTAVLGTGDVGAGMALTLSYWSSDLIYINHDSKQVSQKLQAKLNEHTIVTENDSIQDVIHENGQIQIIKTASGRQYEVDKAFVAFGGNQVRSDLAVQLGAETLKNHHIIVDPQTKMTSVHGLWAAGDTVAHSELVTAAMGEASIAALWIHKKLMNE